MLHYSNFNPTTYTTYKAKKRSHHGCELESDDILTFDIEVSSAWLVDGKLVPYTPHKSEEFWNMHPSFSLCYIWQFSYNGTVYFGRDLREFVAVLSKLPNHIHFIIWVHNLAYEFEFLSNLFEWESVFARKAHSAMKATPAMFPNIEFRCSYYLTRMSLATWGREVGLPKLVGDLDYNKLRTPNTPLTMTELGYCARDCEVVDLGIQKYRDKYKHVNDIPLTQTGEVRREAKKRMRKSASDMRWMVKLLPADAVMYAKLKTAFAGGYTHANALYAARTIRSKEGCAFDFASSYPAVMCSEKFPATPFFPDVFDESKTDERAYLMKVRFECVEPLKFNHYISSSKCVELSDDAVIDNGRLIRATVATLWITEVDYDIIMQAYECEPHVLECYSSRKAYLPRAIIQYVLELYNNKTQYKGKPDKKDIYAISKQFINSMFGMSVTDLIQDDVFYDNAGCWEVAKKTVEDVNKYLDDLRYNNRNRTFMAYQFGVWITAYARHNLWECLLSCDKDALYCDTDSIKVRKRYDFSWYNDKVTAKIIKCCNARGVDPDLANPMGYKSKDDHTLVHYPLGVFVEEDMWSEFKTLGAKRYCYRDVEDGQLHLTVSGISKQAVICLHDDIENFNEDTVFDKDYFTDFKEAIDNGEHWCDQFDGLTFDEICAKYKIEDGTKKMHVYRHDMEPVVWNEGCEDEYYSDYFQGITMRPTSYSMSMTDEYLDVIEQFLLNEDEHLDCIGKELAM